MKLVQKHPFKGTREFEIVEDVINVRVKSLLREEKITVGLTTLDPDPVINKSCLEFNSRATGAPLLSLFLNRPDAEAFNAFVDVLRLHAQGQQGGYADPDAAAHPAGFTGNVYEEPPAFEQSASDKKRPSVNAARVDEDIRMLEQYVDAEEIKPLLVALEALKAEPQSEAAYSQMVNAFNELGLVQGAVLTYAPYITVLLSYEVGEDQDWTR